MKDKGNKGDFKIPDEALKKIKSQSELDDFFSDTLNLILVVMQALIRTIALIEGDVDGNGDGIISYREASWMFQKTLRLLI